MWSFYARIEKVTKTLITRGIQLTSASSKFDEILMLGRVPGIGCDIDFPLRQWDFMAHSDSFHGSKKSLTKRDYPNDHYLESYRQMQIEKIKNAGWRHVVDCPIEEMVDRDYANFSRYLTERGKKHNGGLVVLVGQTINNYLTSQLQNRLEECQVDERFKGKNPREMWNASQSTMNWCEDAVPYDDFFIKQAFMEKGRERLGSLEEALAAHLTNFYSDPVSVGLEDYCFEQNAICPVW